MAPRNKKQDEQLQLADQLIKSKAPIETMSQYHRDLIKWARNIDQRYAWLVMVALWVMMGLSLGPYRVYGLIYAHVTQEGIYTREEASGPVSVIYTVTNLIGPIVSMIIYYISYRYSMLLGGLLITTGNILGYYSDSLWMDTIVIGIIQGVGIAFVFMPFMEIINNYFIRRRNLALGVALCGGTMSVFALSPLCRYLLENYPWRTAYLGIGSICLAGILIVPLFKPNPRPKAPPEDDGTETFGAGGLGLSKTGALERHQSVISVTPGARSVGMERKISRAIKPVDPQQTPHVFETNNNNNDQEEGNKMGLPAVISILKTPGFHVIWYMQSLFYWLFTIFSLIVVDFGVDHGCSLEEAESLLICQSAGEIFGRMVLPAIVDLNLISLQSTVVIVLLFIIGALVMFTQTTGFICMATLTMILAAFVCLIYVLLNGLLLTFVGERKVTLGFGMSSSIVGVLVFARPLAVGFFRDTMGSYDPLFWCLAAACAFGIVMVTIEPLISRICGKRNNLIEESSG